MPFVHHPLLNRRSFLKLSAMGGATLLSTGAGRAVNPDHSRRELHLALLADTHIPGDPTGEYRGFRPAENLRRIVPDLLSAAPESAVIAGDAARLAGLIADYQELQRILEPVAAELPVIIGLGNHDDRGNFFKVFPEPPGNRPAAGGKHVTILEHDVVRVVVLDSLLYVDRVAGLLGRAQRQWLEAHLPLTADRPLVLVVHHTLGDGDGDLLDADRLFAILRPYPHVRAIFHGHSHVWNLSRRDHLHLVNLPAIGYNFRDQDPVGWVQARFTRSGVSLTLRAIAGNQAEDGRVFELKWNG